MDTTGRREQTLVVRERVPIFLKQRVDARNAAVPRIFQIFQRQPAILRVGLLALERVLGPDALRVDELALPGLHVPTRVDSPGLTTEDADSVPEEVRDDLVLLVGHAAPEVRDALVRLLGVAQILCEHRRETL